MTTETPITYRIEEEMLGPDATEEQARRMVELLQERGYNVEYGPAIGQDPDTIPASVWEECCQQLSPAAQTAQSIYREVYGHIDDKHFKAQKLAEIEEWLTEGDPSDDIAELIAEWRKYDAA